MYLGGMSLSEYVLAENQLKPGNAKAPVAKEMSANARMVEMSLGNDGFRELQIWGERGQKRRIEDNALI